jgi:hypothetical protein
MHTEYLKTFPDWLSISYPTSMSPHLDLVSFFTTLSPLEYLDLGGSKQLYKAISGGSIFITAKTDYVNISISGSLLKQCRESGLNNDLQQILASAPYNITRLDIAYDLPICGTLAIDSIQSTYPLGFASIASRSRQLQYILTQVTDKTKTGTVYFQNSKYKGTIKLKVYDKTHEVFQKTCTVIPSTTRYELSICRGASLKDFAQPTSAFWHFLPTELLKRPDESLIPKWKATERINYDDYTSPSPTDYERLKFLIENHPVLKQLIQETKRVHGGELLLKQQINSLLLTNAARHVESETSVTSLIAEKAS